MCHWKIQHLFFSGCCGHAAPCWAPVFMNVERWAPDAEGIALIVEMPRMLRVVVSLTHIPAQIPRPVILLVGRSSFTCRPGAKGSGRVSSYSVVLREEPAPAPQRLRDTYTPHRHCLRAATNTQMGRPHKAHFTYHALSQCKESLSDEKPFEEINTLCGEMLTS